MAHICVADTRECEANICKTPLISSPEIILVQFTKTVEITRKKNTVPASDSSKSLKKKLTRIVTTLEATKQVLCNI